MSKRNARPRGRQRGYYDPGANPQPRLPGASSAAIGPTGNSRPQRRQRALLPFAAQAKLAESLGFEIPETYPDGPKGPADRARWIERWEEQYARR